MCLGLSRALLLIFTSLICIIKHYIILSMILLVSLSHTNGIIVRVSEGVGWVRGSHGGVDHITYTPFPPPKKDLILKYYNFQTLLDFSYEFSSFLINSKINICSSNVTFSTFEDRIQSMTIIREVVYVYGRILFVSLFLTLHW